MDVPFLVLCFGNGRDTFLTMRNVCIVVLWFASLTACIAGWLADVGKALQTATNVASEASALSGAPSSLSALSADQAVQAMKEALAKGVQSAVSNLGHDGGFLTNLRVKIPLPEKLQTAEAALRLAGKGKLADDFVATMNHAAEQAVPVAAGVFSDTVKQMSIADAKAILAGPSDAATQYFRKATQSHLYDGFLPVVKGATEKVGVTSAYKQMVGKAGAAQSLGGLFGVKAPALLEQADLDSYVTNQALDGLFKMVADEEKRIREDPLARTTDLLRKAFGGTTK